MWTTEYIISQICMALGMSMLGATYFIKSNKTILIFSIINAILFCGHYFFLGAYLAVVLNAVGILRGVWYYFANKYSRKSQTIAMLTIVGINIICGALTANVWVDILALIAIAHYSFAVWQKNVLYYRITAIIEGVIWIIYNVFYMSILGILSQGILLVVSIMSVVTYLYKFKNNKKEIKTNIKEQDVHEDTI